MAEHAARRAANREPIPAANPVSGDSPPHIDRRLVRDAIRVCMDLGYAVSGAEAWALLKEWRAWQECDARRFVAAEFRLYVQRRGDLVQIRGKRHHEWAVHT